MKKDFSNNLENLNKLQHLATLKFQQFFEKNKEKMFCRSGCSQCCHAQFSLFFSECCLIVNWFLNLNLVEQNEVLKKIRQNLESVSEKTICPFLHEDSCAIYESRPVICRTQGMAIETGRELDICPLNLSVLQNFDGAGALNLPKLNHLQSQVEIEFKSQFSESSGWEKNLKQLQNDAGRIEMVRLAQFMSTDVFF
jgi:uncharacterized protein